MKKIAALCLTLLFSFGAFGYQDPVPVKKAVEDFLLPQTKDLPGRVSLSIGGLSPNNSLAPCAAFEVSQAPGAKAWGRTSVRVRCTQERGWTIFVPVHIKVAANYLVTARPLSQGQAITDEDVGFQTGELSELPNGILTDPRQAVGRTAAMQIPAGRPLRSDMLRQVLAIQQGQNVKVVSQGTGFQVANEGKALNNAAEGQVAQVRLNNGQIVSGIARRNGQVEIAF